MTTFNPAPDGTPVKSFERSCARKKFVYENVKEAWKHLLKIRAEKPDFAKVVPYQCEWCGKWHIGNMPGNGVRICT